MRCYFCNEEIDNRCINCDNDIIYDKKYIYYKGIKYKEIDFVSRVCSFNFSKDNHYSSRKYHLNLENNKVLEFFKRNIKKYTFLGLYLPCAVFLFVFLASISFWFMFKREANFTEMNVLIFYLFLGTLFLMFGIIKLIQIIKGKKCYISKIRGQIGYRYINNDEYKKICEELSR